MDGGTPQRKAGLHVDSLSSVHIANREEEETGREGRGVSKLLPIGDKGGHFILGKGWVEDRRCYTYALQGVSTWPPLCQIQRPGTAEWTGRLWAGKEEENTTELTEGSSILSNHLLLCPLGMMTIKTPSSFNY